MFQPFNQGGRYYRDCMHDTRYLQFLIIQWHVKYRMDGKKMESGVGEFACYRGEGMEVKGNVKNTEFLCRGDIQFTNSFFFFLFVLPLDVAAVCAAGKQNLLDWVVLKKERGQKEIWLNIGNTFIFECD